MEQQNTLSQVSQNQFEQGEHNQIDRPAQFKDPELMSHCQPITHQEFNPPSSTQPVVTQPKNTTKRKTASPGTRNRGESGARTHEDNAKLAHILKQRKDLSQELVRLQYEEQMVKQKNKKIAPRNSPSHLTKEEIYNIHKALEARKQFQIAAARKSALLEERVREEEKEEEERSKQKVKDMKKNHKKQAIQQLQLLRARQLSRSRELKQASKEYKQVKNRKYKHQKMEQAWQIQKEKQSEMLQSVKKKLRHEKHFSIQQIENHNKKYKEEKIKDEKARKSKFTLEKIAMKQMQKATLHQFRPSAFLRTIFEEQKLNKRDKEIKETQYRTFSLKKTQYAESVREIHQSRWKNLLHPIKQHQQKKIDDKKDDNLGKEKKTACSLSQVELNKLGNSYMREIHSSIAHVDLQEDKNSLVKINNRVQDHKYQDYLTSMRLKREAKSRQSKVINPQVRQLKEFRSVLRSKGNVSDKLAKVQFIASRLEQRVAQDPRLMVASINAKLEMINKLVQSQQKQF